jgi:hypothetical protein
VYDNASENTGQISGVGQRLIAERRRRWKADHHDGEPPALIRKGCADHIVNLTTPTFKASLTKKVGKKLPDLVESVLRSVAVICGGRDHRREWLGFVGLFGIRNVGDHTIKPIKGKSRYLDFETTALFLFRNIHLIMMRYLHQWPLLTSKEKVTFYNLCDPEVRLLIKIRALGCANLLKPIMKKSAKIEEVHDYAKFLGDLHTKLGDHKALWDDWHTNGTASLFLPTLAPMIASLTSHYLQLKDKQDVFDGFIQELEFHKYKNNVLNGITHVQGVLSSRNLRLQVNAPTLTPTLTHTEVSRSSTSVQVQAIQAIQAVQAVQAVQAQVSQAPKSMRIEEKAEMVRLSHPTLPSPS